jgi:hypothetical protein
MPGVSVMDSSVVHDGRRVDRACYKACCDRGQALGNPERLSAAIAGFCPVHPEWIFVVTVNEP